jgi:hypothetical protein
MKSTSIFLILATCFFVLPFLAGCSDGKGIPLDEERAKLHIIPLRQVDAYRAGFAKATGTLRGLVRDTNFLKTSFDLPVAEMFNRDAIALLLNQKDADGIRIYFGVDEKGQVRLVLLPVDKKGKDIRTVLLKNLTQQAGTQLNEYGDGGGGQGVEVGQRCPTVCD